MTDKMKLEFAPGCFDNFEGSQEELDELQAEIMRMFESGELAENARVIDLDAVAEDDPELAEMLFNKLLNPDNDKRTLQ